jgi:hypothetical protein
MNPPKLPKKELLGEKQLDGVYKVSFNIEVSTSDDLFIDDLTQALANGFDDSTVLPKISNLDLEKLNKDGSLKSKDLQVGDIVRLTTDTKINANILYDDGYYVIGKETETTESLGEMSVILKAGSHAVVNQITKEGIELIDFDSCVEVPLMDPETDEINTTQVNVDLITLEDVNLERVEK